MENTRILTTKTSKAVTAILAFLRQLLKMIGGYVTCFKEAVRYWWLLSRFPGPPSLPIVGHLLNCGFLATMEDLIQYFTLYASICKVCRLQFGFINVISIWEAEDIEAVFSKKENVNKSPTIYKHVAKLLGEGLVTNTGEVWRRHIRAVSPAFRPPVVYALLPLFRRHCEDFVGRLRACAGRGAVDVKPFVRKLLFQITCEATMGVDMNDEESLRFVDAANTLLELGALRIMKPWLHPDFIFNRTEMGRACRAARNTTVQFRNKVIRERKEELQALAEQGDAPTEDEWGKRRQLAFLDHVLLQTREAVKLSEKEISDEVDSVITAGYEATSSILQYLFYFLAKHQDVQERIAQELNGIFGQSEPFDITIDHILYQLNYTEMVIKEALRMNPPIWTVTKSCETDIRLPSSGLVLPAGANVMLLHRLAHKNPKHFPDPDVFDPERFSAEETRKRHPWAFLPFSLGPRTCLGKRYAMVELKLILSMLIWNFKLTPDPDFTLVRGCSVPDQPQNEVRVMLEERIK